MPVYLDNAATTKVCPQAAQAALEVMTETYGNPSSRHALGTLAAARLKEYRSSISGALGCGADSLYFTSGGTESDNWAISIAINKGRRIGRHIITTAIEHSAVLEPLKALEEQGYEITRLSPDKNGHIKTDDLSAALRADTVLVSMMLVNNELGTLQPVAEAATILKRAGSSALLHTDAVQAFCKVPFTPGSLGVDLLSVCGHKMGAPKGIGALYIRKGLTAAPLLLGGGQESSLRSGTEPMPQIASFAAACALRRTAFQDDTAHMAEVKAAGLAMLSQAIPELVVLSPGDAPHICAISLPGYPGEMLVRALSDRGVYVSSGSACHRGKPSHVYAALGLSKAALTGALRISLSPENTVSDVRALCEALVQIKNERLSAMR